MPRRELLAAAVGLAVLVAVGAFAAWPRPDRVTRENCDRIRKGMSRAEVEAIFGGPPGDYRTVETADEYHEPRSDPENPTRAADRLYKRTVMLSRDGLRGDWLGNEGLALVFFESGRVADANRGEGMWLGDTYYKVFQPTAKREYGPLDNLLWRAKRLWRKCFPVR
jgi:hypothetical protein